MPRRGFFRRPKRLQLLLTIGLAASLLAGLSPTRALAAQDAIQAAMERRGPVSPEKRAELYRQLSQHAQILEAQAAVVKTVAKLIGPAVVHIETDVTGRSALQYGRGRHVEEAGAGVIVQWKGKPVVLTNRHVVSGAPPSRIRVHLGDGRMVHPQKISADEYTDVAVLAISATQLVAAQIGDSDAMEIGDFVLAVGSPFGLTYSVTYGIISAKGRRGLDLGRGRSGVRLQDFIQTDAAINPGNSGGPLVNLRGEVIGINTAIASNSGGSEGIAFAIPVNMFMHVAGQLIEHGSVSRAYLGVKLDSSFDAEKAISLGLPRLVGAQVREVTKDSPAEAAKLKEGDVILQIDDVPIEDDYHLVNVVHMTEIGKEVSVLVLRDGKQFRVKVAVADLKDFPDSG